MVAGNYAAVRDLVWSRADTLLWLDLPLPSVLARATRRALRQWWTGESICNGNRQTLLQMVNGRDSLLRYTLLTFHARRRAWPQLLAQQTHATVARLPDQRAIDAWKSVVQAGNTPVDR